MNRNQTEKWPHKEGGYDDEKGAKNGSDKRFAWITGASKSIGDGSGLKKLDSGAGGGSKSDMEIHPCRFNELQSHSTISVNAMAHNTRHATFKDFRRPRQ